jgi:formate hydrogenlyase transcriptional activator
MSNAQPDQQATATGDQYRALFAVSDVIASHRDLPALLHELALRLARVVQFDALSMVLHDVATNTMRLHVLEAAEPLKSPIVIVLNPEDDPAGLVWQTQQPLRTSKVEDLRRWPKLLERVQPHGVQSLCWLPLTTARRRLGALVFISKQPATYDRADVHFLQLIVNQVAVAVENALAFQEIEALKDKLADEKAYLEEEVRTEHEFGDIIGESPILLSVLKKVATVAPTDSTVLVYGETGTGKELIARAVHDLSPRKGRTFVKLNCAAIPTGLLESELFGHERGAFTGAIAQKIGRFERATQGTLFLDEVGDIPLELQSKLLRVLQEQEFERLGGTRTIKVNVRLVAATNCDLAKMVADKDFRSDLYYRLNVFPLTLPPLRERQDDIPWLVRHFTHRFARRMHRDIETIPASVMEALVRYPWPGNVRELQNIIERAVILSNGPVLQVSLSDLQVPVGTNGDAVPAPITLTDAEREHIMAALAATGWVVGGPKGAAARLGMKRSSIATTWMQQRTQSIRAHAEWRQREREALFNEFIKEASRLAIEALMNSMERPDPIMTLYGILSRIRLMSGQDVVRQGEACCRQIVEQYGQPNLTTDQFRLLIAANRVEELDPLREFSSACRKELLDRQG